MRRVPRLCCPTFFRLPTTIAQSHRFQAAANSAHTAVNKINPPISQRQPEKPAQSS
nr:hypothetical protein [uncultured Kingella sp.]